MLVLRWTKCLSHSRVPERLPLPDAFLDLEQTVEKFLKVETREWALKVCESLLLVSTLGSVITCFFHKHRFELSITCN